MPRATNETLNAETGELIVEVVPWTRDALAEHLAAVRYEWEVAGITVDGLEVSTERGNERTTWVQLMATARADASFSIRKKMAGRFVTLRAPQILLCGLRGTQYSTACFAVEDRLLSDIDAATTDAQLDAIADRIADPATWPTRIYTTTAPPTGL